MKIVFDLDGVLRDLHGYLINKVGLPYPEQWHFLYNGKNIFEIVKDDYYHSLVYSPGTEYFSVIQEYSPLELWTCQPPTWRPYTEMWIRENLGSPTKRYLTTEEKREYLDYRKDTYLVEDSPNFSNYDRIILIDKPYNKHIKCELRIHSPKGLEYIINYITKKVR